MTEKGKSLKFKVTVGTETSDFELSKNCFILGRGASADLGLKSKKYSRKHLKFTQIDDEHWTVEDLKSTHGSFINGMRLNPDKEIRIKFPVRIRTERCEEEITLDLHQEIIANPSISLDDDDSQKFEYSSIVQSDIPNEHTAIEHDELSFIDDDSPSADKDDLSKNEIDIFESSMDAEFDSDADNLPLEFPVAEARKEIPIIPEKKPVPKPKAEVKRPREEVKLPQAPVAAVKPVPRRSPIIKQPSIDDIINSEEFIVALQMKGQELESNIKVNQNLKATLQDELDSLLGATKIHKLERDKIEKSLEEKRKLLSNLQIELQSSMTEFNQIQSIVDDYCSDIVDLSHAIQVGEKSLSQVETFVESLSEEKIKLEIDLIQIRESEKASRAQEDYLKSNILKLIGQNNTAKETHETLHAQVDESTKHLSSLQETINEVISKIQIKEKALKTYDKKVSKGRLFLNSVEKKKLEADNILGQLQKKLIDSETEVKRKSQELTSIETSIASQKERYSILKDDLTAKHKELEAINVDLSEKEKLTQQHSEKLAKLHQEIQQAEGRLNEFNDQHRATIEKIEFYKAELDSSSNALNDLNSTIAAKRSTQDELQKMLSDLDTKIALQKQELLLETQNLSNLQESIKRAEEKLEICNVDLRKLKDDTEVESSKFNDLSQKNNSLVSEMKNIEAQKIKFQDELRQKESELIITNQALQSCHEELSNDQIKLQSFNHKSKLQMEDTKREIQSVVKDLELKSSTLQAVQSNLKAVEIRFEQIESSIKELDTQKAKKLLELENVQSRWKDSEEKLASIQMEIQNFKEERKSLSDGNVNLVNQLSEKVKLREVELEKEFLEKSKLLERRLSEREVESQISIENQQKQWQQDRASRLDRDLKQIEKIAQTIFDARLASSLSGSSNLEQLKSTFVKDLLGAQREILASDLPEEKVTNFELRNVLSLAPRASELASKYWKTKGIQLGSVLAVCIIFLIFPSIPKGIYNGFQNSISRKPASADQFVDQVRVDRVQRSIFNVEQDKVFRNTYTDNVIYLLGYIQLKNNEDIKKNWTLKLNEFFIHELDLSDRIVVDFVAIETPMLKELNDLRSKITPQTKEITIQRMNDFEQLSKNRLIEVVGGEDNFKKLREFEKEFYNSYASEL